MQGSDSLFKIQLAKFLRSLNTLDCIFEAASDKKFLLVQGQKGEMSIDFNVTYSLLPQPSDLIILIIKLSLIWSPLAT